MVLWTYVILSRSHSSALLGIYKTQNDVYQYCKLNGQYAEAHAHIHKTEGHNVGLILGSQSKIYGHLKFRYRFF
jgi:hypothetical protein